MKILHKESSYYAFYQKSSKEKKKLKIYKYYRKNAERAVKR